MSEAPVPAVTPETRPYWDGAARHELWLPKCVESGNVFFPPQHVSPFTGGAVDWVRASGEATLASFIITHIPSPGYGPEPYVIALVRLREGPILTANIRDVEPIPEKLAIGMPLRVVFESRGAVTLPQFVPAPQEGP